MTPSTDPDKIVEAFWSEVNDGPGHTPANTSAAISTAAEMVRFANHASRTATRTPGQLGSQIYAASQIINRLPQLLEQLAVDAERHGDDPTLRLSGDRAETPQQGALMVAAFLRQTARKLGAAHTPIDAAFQTVSSLTVHIPEDDEDEEGDR